MAYGKTIKGPNHVDATHLINRINRLALLLAKRYPFPSPASTFDDETTRGVRPV